MCQLWGRMLLLQKTFYRMGHCNCKTACQTRCSCKELNFHAHLLVNHVKLRIHTINLYWNFEYSIGGQYTTFGSLVSQPYNIFTNLIILEYCLSDMLTMLPNWQKGGYWPHLRDISKLKWKMRMFIIWQLFPSSIILPYILLKVK